MENILQIALANQWSEEVVWESIPETNAQKIPLGE